MRASFPLAILAFAALGCGLSAEDKVFEGTYNDDGWDPDKLVLKVGAKNEDGTFKAIFSAMYEEEFTDYEGTISSLAADGEVKAVIVAVDTSGGGDEEDVTCTGTLKGDTIELKYEHGSGEGTMTLKLKK